VLAWFVIQLSWPDPLLDTLDGQGVLGKNSNISHDFLLYFALVDIGYDCTVSATG